MRFNKYFQVAEMACKCGCGFGTKPGDIDERVVWIATCARIHFAAPVTITSACRCPSHNAKVGGAKASRHQPQGALNGASSALDIKVKGVAPAQVQAFLDELLAGRFGVGYGETFTHVDTRDTPARFDY